MNAGRELDALIAEKVMGWACVHSVEYLPRSERESEINAEFLRDYGMPAPPGFCKAAVDDLEFSDGDYPPKWCAKCGGRESRDIFKKLPHYSTDIGDAWDVVEAVAARSETVYFTVERIGAHAGEFSGYRAFINRICTAADTAPLAICRAALKAVGEDS